VASLEHSQLVDLLKYNNQRVHIVAVRSAVGHQTTKSVDAGGGLSAVSDRSHPVDVASRAANVIDDSLLRGLDSDIKRLKAVNRSSSASTLSARPAMHTSQDELATTSTLRDTVLTLATAGVSGKPSDRTMDCVSKTNTTASVDLRPVEVRFVASVGVLYRC